MEGVVATVSGYHGSERFKLIKLISHSGASYVGAMSKSITHLVCWKFEGKKYSLAKKFKTIIVNHQWVEECIKQGRRVPERPYMSQCGEEIGPLAIEIPPVSGENKLSGTVDKFRDKGCESRSAGFSELAAWTDSILLKESPALQRNVGSDAYSLRLTRKKRNSIFEGKENACLAESSKKGRRLVKKNTCKNIVNLESDQESDINRPNVLCDQRSNHATAPKHPDEENGNVGTAEHTEASTHQLFAHSGTPNQGLGEIEETENWNHPSCFKVPRPSHADVSNNAERTPQDDGSNVEPDSTTEDTEATGKIVTIPPPAEVSCVICWTEFSSTRGILPCGHRFCYSCIQNWADRMVSQQKNSACPLCKAGFKTITKVEDAGSSDQKIYSQTVPCPSSTKDILILPEQERLNFRFPPVASVCTRCFSREPEDLLIRCNICSYRCIHSYCLDPYLLPWTCTHCNNMQMLYQRGY